MAEHDPGALQPGTLVRLTAAGRAYMQKVARDRPFGDVFVVKADRGPAGKRGRFITVWPPTAWEWEPGTNIVLVSAEYEVVDGEPVSVPDSPPTPGLEYEDEEEEYEDYDEADEDDE